jgi:hypothetical protein
MHALSGSVRLGNGVQGVTGGGIASPKALELVTGLEAVERLLYAQNAIKAL